MTGPLDGLPPRWRDHRLVLSDHGKHAGARFLADDDALVVLTPATRGTAVAGYGDPARVVGVVGDLVGRGELVAPLHWLAIPREVDLPARVCDALHLTPLPGFDWMSTTRPADAPGMGRVTPLDLPGDVPAIVNCLSEGNPTTDSDPARAGEAGWWGVREGERLVGVIGAAVRGGASDDGFSWHLHGLGVRPAARRGGLGTALLVAAANAGLSSGADWVSLGVWADNEPALRIYRRLGWRTDARMRSYRPAEHPASRTPR